MEKEWYEQVIAEEIKAIKAAMVSGHWYNCENGQTSRKFVLSRYF